MSATTPTSVRAESTPENEPLIERLVERENMIKAYKRVVGNKGAPGVDGIPVDQLEPYLQAHWSEIKVLSISIQHLDRSNINDACPVLFLGSHSENASKQALELLNKIVSGGFIYIIATMNLS